MRILGTYFLSFGGESSRMMLSLLPDWIDWRQRKRRYGVALHLKSIEQLESLVDHFDLNIDSVLLLKQFPLLFLPSLHLWRLDTIATP